MGISMLRKRTPQICVRLFLLLSAVAFSCESAAPAAQTADQFEVYCDGFAIFLKNVDGAPASGRLVLASLGHYRPALPGGVELAIRNWTAASVLPDGCIPDGKCEGTGKGRVWIDKWDDARDAIPKRISGKYELELNGKKLEGTFAAKLFKRKEPLRICM